MSSIEFTDHNLAPVHYEELLKAVQATLRDLTNERDKGKVKEYLHLSATNLACDIDSIANIVATRFESGNHFPFDIREGLSYATIHTLDVNEKTGFSYDLNNVFTELRTQILDRMEQNLQHRSLESYVSDLLTPIDTFIKDRAVGLAYPLNKEHAMEKRSLHANNDDKTSNNAWLKAHKLTLNVTSIDSFNEQIVQSIKAYIEQHQGCDEDDLADVHESLATAKTQETSNLNQLKNIVVKESVARIQREARVRYLRYLLEGLQEWQKQFHLPQSENAQKLHKAIRLLHIFITRLNSLDAYIRHSDKEYSYYTVFLNKEEFNYRDIFSPAHAFNALPIISEVDGFLGESTDQQRQAKIFTSGVKLKLNGPVHNHGGNGRSVFEFNVALLDPTSAECQGRAKAARQGRTFYEKVLKVALLYCFVFCEMENKDFRPGRYFEQEILPTLRSNDDQQAFATLQKLKEKITHPTVTANLDLLREQLLGFLKTGKVGPSRREYPLALVLDKSILTKDINQIIQGNFFQEIFDSRNGRNALKYLSVVKDTSNPNTLSKLPLTLVFEPIYYHPKNEQPEQFKMRTETEGIQVLPTFLAPIDQDAPAKYKDAYKDVRRLAFYYRHRPTIHSDSARAFIYRFTYALLSYMITKLLVDSLPDQHKGTIFTPIICIHANKEQEADEKGEKLDDETFMHALTKLLAHMLGEDYLSGSQGLHVDTVQNNQHKLGNALYSLYSALPHSFKLQQSNPEAPNEVPTTMRPHQFQLNKLAIIVVSSRKCDENLKSPDYYESTICGKVIGVERSQNDTVIIHTLTTFSANQNSREMFSRPDVLIEQVKKYHLQGYDHFIYVARAPYTSTLNISDSSNKDLFFMNKDIIQAMRQIDSNIKIYPVFCDKYYVIDRKSAQVSKEELLRADSLYIDDIGELTSVSNDRSRRSQIFFNLFNGIKVNPQAIYSGVMSYAILINVYENDPTYDQYIWSDMLTASISTSLKTEILDFITLLHFSRYEKASQKKNPIGFKLDPYMDIIGDKSVGARSIFPNMNGRARFNALAFLTVVRAVIHAQK